MIGVVSAEPLPSPCLPGGSVRLSAKLACPFKPVDVHLQVRPGCPNGEAGPTAIRSLRITNPLPASVVPYSSQPEQPEPVQAVPEWVFNGVPVEGITVSHTIQATRPGSYLIGAEALVEIEDDAGRRATGGLQPEVLTVAETCGPRRETAVFLPLVYRPLCVPSRQPVDVVILLDRSGSMGTGTFAATSRHIGAFAADLATARGRVALVAFDQRASLLARLGSSPGQIERVSADLALAPGTRIERAIRSGEAELSGERGRTGRRRLLVLVTDGVQTGPGGTESVLAAAAGARARGVIILALALGPAPDGELLAAVAGQPGRVVAAPTPDDVPAAYRTLAALAACANG